MFFTFSSSIADGSLLQGIFKLLFVVTALLYVGFAFVVTRQIKIMRTTLITTFSPFVRTLGYAHLLLAIAVLVLFTVIL